MARTFREDFDHQVQKVSNIDDDAVSSALRQFADALDPEFPRQELPQPKPTGGVEHFQPTNSTAKNYLLRLRVCFERGLDLLDVDAETVNDFMLDLVSKPEQRRTDLVEYNGKMTKPSAQTYQSALIAFYRWCDEPGNAADRPDTPIDWPADEIVIFREQSDPKHDEEDMPTDEDLDAMREACIRSRNTRRDRAFLELAAGTGQRVYALVTLRIKDVYLDEDPPFILLNPAIDGDGDKRAIEFTGRWKPIVSDTGPIREWIDHHPLRDREIREEEGAPEDFDECYLFVGDRNQYQTDLSTHLSRGAARGMLERRQADTEDLPSVKTVEIPVNPHNWRHYAYTQSQDLPIDESTRRKVFGWAPGSDTGSRIYGHKKNRDAGEEYAEAWSEEFEQAVVSVDTMIGDIASNDDLSPEAREKLVRSLAQDDDLMDDLAERVAAINGD